nr:hypothetical protein [Escherichia coli]
MLSLQQGGYMTLAQFAMTSVCHDFLARPGSTDPGGDYYRSDCQLVA